MDVRWKDKRAPARIPSGRAYRLRLSRYRAAAETFRGFIERQTDSKARFSILDVGVGRGRLMQYLDPEGTLGDGLRWVGIDNDKTKLENTWGPHRWQLHCVDIVDGLPFPDGTFDMVFCEQMLEHLADPTSALAEIVRILRPGGMLIVGVPSFPPGIAWLRGQLVALAKRLAGGYARSHVQTFSKRSFLVLCTACGLEVETVRGFRIVSGGPFAFLEDYHLWYRLNRWLGEKLPGLCIEVQVVATKAALQSTALTHRDHETSHSAGEIVA